MSPARCRWRSRPKASRCAPSCRAIPAVMDALAAPRRCCDWPNCSSAARRALLGGTCGGPRAVRARCAASLCASGQSLSSARRQDWPDNALRFAALARMAADIGLGAIPAFVPDIVHAHDWQAGLAPAYLHYSGRPRPGTVMTVHNLAFQGQFPQRACWARSGCRRTPSPWTASNIMAPSVS